ncbi:phosphoglycolate phosphatase [Peptococcaceae bacterium CEB3]|nr:phosphoglycolate phosphatase [Peptococcaceae bacterium CEB3]
MMIDSILFDLDGTLWDSTDVVVRAWNQVLRKTGGPIQVTAEEIQGVMGLQQPEIAQKLLPGLESGTAKELMAECNAWECDMLRREGGRVFAGLEETLRQLYPKFPLFIVSNCQCGYIESFLFAHDLGKYFIDFECAGKTGLPKGENIKTVIARNGLKSPVYVGDTDGDREAAHLTGTPFIFAAYGFGNPLDHDYIIHSPLDLIELVLQ